MCLVLSSHVGLGHYKHRMAFDGWGLPLTVKLPREASTRTADSLGEPECLSLMCERVHGWQVDPRTRARLHHRLNLDAMPEAERQLAFWLRGLMELCIYPPRPHTPHTPGQALYRQKKMLFVHLTSIARARGSLCQIPDSML